MEKIRPSSRRLILASFLAILPALLASCTTGEAEGTGARQTGKPDYPFLLKHLDFADASEEFRIMDDVPAGTKVLLNGIPGGFGGNPTGDELFTVEPGRASFRIPWDTLARFPASTQPKPYLPMGLPLDSISPDTVRIMRMGTFAEAGSPGPVFPAAIMEAYGFFDLKTKTSTSLMYFSGAAVLHADRQLCDLSRLHADLRIPQAGFYFLHWKTEGGNTDLALLPASSEPVFAISTMSREHVDKHSEEYAAKFGCLDGLAKAGTSAGALGNSRKAAFFP